MKAAAVLATLATLAVSSQAFAGDIVPYFHRDPKPAAYGPPFPHPTVPGCAIDDARCVAEHDALVQDMAIASGERDGCASSSRPAACADVFDMVVGDVKLTPDPILSDPCAVVVSVRKRVAMVMSEALGVTRSMLNRGWRAGQTIGTCAAAMGPRAVASSKPVVNVDRRIPRP
jgi:hypothetical protein